MWAHVEHPAPPVAVDPSQMATARSLRFTGITPVSSLLRSSPSPPGAADTLASDRVLALKPRALGDVFDR
jgi:hypothetical protein